MQFIDPADIINKEIFKKIENDCVCSICTGITQISIQCTKCKHNFCQACLDNWLIKHQTCPYKCGPSIKKKKNVELDELIHKFIFKCKLGCEQGIKFNDLEEHYKIQCSKIDLIKKCSEMKKRIEELDKKKAMISYMKSKISEHLKNKKNNVNQSYYNDLMKQHPRHFNSSSGQGQGFGAKDAAHLAPNNFGSKIQDYQDMFTEDVEEEDNNNLF